VEIVFYEIVVPIICVSLSGVLAYNFDTYRKDEQIILLSTAISLF